MTPVRPAVLPSVRRRGRGPRSTVPPLLAIAILAAGGVGPLGAQGVATGAITGTVWDSTRAAPLAGAEVFLAGTAIAVASNEDGRFLIPGLRPGTYAIGFRHPRLELLGWLMDGVTVQVRAGETVDVRLAVPREPPRSGPLVPRPPADPPARTGGPAVIIGTVEDAASGRGIAGATVQVRGTPIGIITDERGRFVLFGLPPGGHTVDVRMLGYADRETPVVAIAGGTLQVVIPLSTQAIELDPVVVEVRSRLLDRVGFYDRLDDPGLRGTFLTPVEIERRAPATFTDLFSGVPGARVDYYGPGRSAVIFRRIVGSGASDGCIPELYLDGMRIRGTDWSFIAPPTVDGVEVYTGVNIPIAYAANNACGVVLVWTKRGG